MRPIATAAAAALCLALSVPSGAQTRFRRPFNEALSLNYGFDCDGSGSNNACKDYNCGGRCYDGHGGTDFPLKLGSWVLAPADGTVIATNNGCGDWGALGNTCGGGCGNYVKIQYGDGTQSLFCHMKLNSIRVGNGGVGCGTHLGDSASSGNSSGPHLHFGYYVGGVRKNLYAGPCSNMPSAWVAQNGYWDPVGADCQVVVPPCRDSKAGFAFACDGPWSGMACVNVSEPADPHTWGDNFFCSSSDLGMVWSHAGPIPGMECTAIQEGAEPAEHGWGDNYLCLPDGAPVGFRWSGAGPIAGLECVRWREPADPHTWDDNYLCVEPRPALQDDPAWQAVFNAHTYGARPLTDLNGDGKADLCARGSAGVSCWTSTGESFAEAPAYHVELSDAQGWGDRGNWQTLRMGDVNGDGRADLCARSNARVLCWPSLLEGPGFGAAIEGPALDDAGGWWRPQYATTLRLADVTGDRRLDLCVRGPAGVRCWPSTGQGFGEEIVGPALSDASGWGAPQYYATLRTGDVDGDGRDDLCARSAAGFSCWLSDGKGFPTEVKGPAWSDASGWGGPQHYGTLRLLDLDGDYKLDVCARSVAGYECYRSTGAEFVPYAVLADLSDASGWSDPTNYLTLRVGDIDGDGRDDVCGRGNAHALCWRSTGEGFSDLIVGPDWSDAWGWAVPRYFSTFQLADVTGDGHADVCARGAAGIFCGASADGGFGAPFAGPALSDQSGWGLERYYATIRVGGPPREPAGPDAGSPDAPSAGPPGEGGGEPDGGGMFAEGCSCSTAAAGPSAFLLLLLAGLTLGRRAR